MPWWYVYIVCMIKVNVLVLLGFGIENVTAIVVRLIWLRKGSCLVLVNGLAVVPGYFG